jgi:hypothetical protein
MSDLKSKIPDLKELSQMTGKLFNDIKTSLEEIISAYKEKRPETEEPEKPLEAKKAAPEKKAKDVAEVKDEKKAEDKVKAKKEKEE